jgi:hypothetical protein
MTTFALDAPDHQDTTRLHCEECDAETPHVCIDERDGSYRVYREQCKRCWTIRTEDRYGVPVRDSPAHKSRHP